MTIGELLIKLQLDSSGAAKGLTAAESQVKGSTGNIGKHFDEAGGHVSKFGGIMSGMAVGAGIALTNLAINGLGKVTDFLGDSEKAFQDAAVSTAKMTTAYNNAGVGISATGDAMEANLKIGNALGFTQDEQRSSLALLVGVTKDADDAQSDMSRAEDLARLKNIDLASATNIVMKAQEGNTGALKKLGIIVAPVTTAMDALTASHKKATVAQIAAAKAADLQATETAALTALDKLAGGQAEAYANTSVGKLAAAHEKVTEAMVKLGAVTDQIVQAVMPPLAAMFDTLVSAAGPVIDSIGQAMPGAMATVGGAIATLQAALAPILATLGQALPGALAAADTAFAGIQTAIGQVRAAVTPLINAALLPLQQTISDITSNQDTLKGALIVLGYVVAVVVVPPMLAWAAATIAAILPIIAIAAGVAALIVILDKTGVLTWLGQNVMPMVSAAGKYLSGTVLPALSAAFKWVTTNILPPLSAAFNFLAKTVLPALSAAAKAIFGAIQTVVKFAVAFVSAEFDILKRAIGVLQTVFRGAGTAVGIVFSGIKMAIGTAVSAVGGSFNILKTAIGIVAGIFTGLRGTVTGVFATIGGSITAVISNVQSMPGKIASAARGMFDGIWSAFKGAINNVIRGWNRLHFSFGGIDMGPLGHVAAFSVGVPHIPTLHSGGIVPGAPGANVLAMLQAGERVTSARDVARGGAGNTFYITNPVPEPPSVSMAHANLMLAYSGRSGN